MIAVLINSADTRLGHTQVSEFCRLIQHRGSYFVRTEDSAVLPGGGLGTVFVGTEKHIYDMLDVYENTPNFSKKPEGAPI